MTDVIYHRIPVECTFEDDPDPGYYAVPITVPLDADGELKLGMLAPLGFVHLDEDFDIACRILALRLFRDEWEHGAFVYRETEVTMGRHKTWLVLTDSEADHAFDKASRQRIDDENIPSWVRIDEEATMNALRSDGRGYALSSYDNIENSIDTDNGTYFIYRQR